MPSFCKCFRGYMMKAGRWWVSSTLIGCSTATEQKSWTFLPPLCCLLLTSTPGSLHYYNPLLPLAILVRAAHAPLSRVPAVA
eukprot:1160482-Pelagomonas_calceolata.AAC.4